MLEKLYPVFTALLLAGGCAGTPVPKGEPVSFTGKVQCAHCDLEIRSSCQKVVTVEGQLNFLVGKQALSFFKKNPEAETVHVTGSKRTDGKHATVRVEKIEKR